MCCLSMLLKFYDVILSLYLYVLDSYTYMNKLYRLYFIKNNIFFKYSIKDNVILVSTNLRYVINDNWDNKTEDILPLFYENEFTEKNQKMLNKLKEFKKGKEKVVIRKYFECVYNKNDIDITNYINFILHLRNYFKLLNKTTLEHLILYDSDKLKIFNEETFDIDEYSFNTYGKNTFIYHLLNIY